MPPRRPGGKYKGVVKTHRGEETLLALAAAAKQRALEEHISRLEAKKDSDQQAAQDLRKQKALKDEASRLWIISSWISSEQQDERKWFKAWIAGVKACKQEKDTRRREMAWRNSCSCGGRSCGPGDRCPAHLRLRDAHADPLAIARAAGRTLFNGPLWLPAPGAAAAGELEAQAAGTLPPLRHAGSAADLRTTGGSGRTAAMSLGATLLHDGSMRRNWSLTSLTEGSGLPKTLCSASFQSGAEERCRGGVWGCHCPLCRAGKKMPSFIDPATATVMVHHKTGRRCLVDPKSMRMVMVDATRPGAVAPFQTVM